MLYREFTQALTDVFAEHAVGPAEMRASAKEVLVLLVFPL
jgi:hypothetical protein